MAAAPTSISCPGSDGTQFTAGGQLFNIHCSTDYYGGDMGLVQTSTFEDCITSCATTQGCLDVAYNGNNCYMKNEFTSSRSNDAVWGAVLASAEEAWDNQISCVNGKSNNVVYTTGGGNSFTISCGTDYFGGDMRNLWTNTFEDCIDTCDSTTGCVDVSYNGNYCYLKNVTTPSQSNSNVWAAKKLPASCNYRPSSGVDGNGYTVFPDTFWSWNGLNYLGTQYEIYTANQAEELCAQIGCNYFTWAPEWQYGDFFQGPTTETPCQSPSSDFKAYVKW